MPRMTRANVRRARVGVANDSRFLLRILLLAAGIVAVCIVIVPLTNDEGSDTNGMKISKDDFVRQKSKSESVTARDPPMEVEEVVDAAVQKKGHDDKVLEEEGGKNEKGPNEIIPEKVQATPVGQKDAFHTVFSTGCSTFQDWQSYVFFYHMLHSGQEGPVTRIASGCKEGDAKDLQDIFEKEIAPMAPGRFRLHLTPDFSGIKHGRNFKYVGTSFGSD